MMANSPTMKIRVGRRKAWAASPRPRRLRMVTNARMPRQMGTVPEERDGKGRSESADTRSDGHRDGEGVVHYQGGGRHQAGAGAEVVPGHGVGPAAAGISGDHLAVGEHQDGQQDDDDDGDRQDQVQSARPGGGQHHDDRLGAVGDRCQGVQRQRREALYRGYLLIAHVAGVGRAGR